MMFCDQCGSPIEEGCAFCGDCGAPAPRNDAAANPSSGNGNIISPSGQAPSQQVEKKRPYRGKPGPNGLPALAENEIVIRRYHCCSIKRPSAEGDLTVTNKRLIFHSEGSSSRVVKEVPINAVGGLDCYTGLNLQMGLLVFGVLLVLSSLFLFSVNGFIGAMVFVAGVGAIIFSIRHSFFMCVYTQNTSSSSISLGSGMFSRGPGNGALYSLQSEPTQDTVRMMVELGAIVQDLQTMGDHAVEKWSE